MKKKVLTITFQRSLNFGASLQAFALVQYLNKNGYQAAAIDYLPKYFAWEIYRPAKGIRKTLDKISKLRKFTLFFNKHIPHTHTVFTSRSLKKFKNIDAFICGSDQIWNPLLTGKKHDPAFFLDFPTSDSLKIAYAASSGSVQLNSLPPKIKDSLLKFNHIGVREERLAAELKASLPNKEITTVADPSLLLDEEDYLPLIKPNISPEREYALSYVVGSGEMLEKFSSRVKELKEVLVSTPVVHAGAKTIKHADHQLLDIGPTEWLSLLHGASYIITNSFHGVAFAIKFKKNFTFIPHTITNLNNRQLTLLTAAGLTHRTLDDSESLTPDSTSDIDYELHENSINNYIQKSRDFLHSSIDLSAC